MNAVFARMQADENVFFLTADMGINLVEKIQQVFPSRYLNVGIAEQNLIGICAGLCNLGFRPVAYTISQFISHRCYEQIRNDLKLHDYPITLLGTSAGFDNAPLGPTHHIVDDWGAVRTIPGIDIYCPSSVSYADTLVDKILAQPRPAYVRIPKGAFEQPASRDDTLYLEGARGGPLLISYGSTVQTCLALQARHAEVSVLVCNRLRPLQADLVRAALQRHPSAFVVEDHFPSSGLYNMLCQFCMEHRLACQLSSLGPREEYHLKVGASAGYYHRLYGFDEQGIERALWGQSHALIDSPNL
ncbi:MAG: hypothetical protein HYW10_03455 [Candidatus Omnitrophica bacterium]|nr:hypothetical protein [Candidatus Omnitrophota bacterium]